LEIRKPGQALAAIAEFAFAGKIEGTRQEAVAEAALGDVFTDDITFPRRTDIC
jgi:hypothetical protein